MRPPSFWQRPPDAPGLRARALTPVAAIVAAATARRVARTGGWRAPVPVICVGNAHLGGTGKTPAVIAIVERLAARGVRAHAVSRGYGGREAGVVQVDPGRHPAARVGDEPLLLAAFAPAWVGRDRAAAARAAVAAGAQAIILDDGFQNPALIKDASILTVDAAQGFGNGRVVPAGPLREPVGAALTRADLVLTIGTPDAQERFGRLWPLEHFAAERIHLTSATTRQNKKSGRSGDSERSWHAPAPLPRIEAALVPLETGMDWRGIPVFAFAGIGRPEKFFTTLRELGADVRGTVSLGDHQPITPALLARIAAEARAAGADLVTTEKDAVRLPREWQGRILVVPVRLEVRDWAPLDAILARLGL